ncbi:hypothetical protein [Nisaea denitrificans]|uniref:hypothetical protein n=1 Tax=Nisaea denitrificans TaxID=390877 RepID=UPI00048C8D9C|nr:hypothetical protein [Nisaea denitrificans]
MIRPLSKCFASLIVLLLVAGCGATVVQSPTGVSGGAKKRVLAFAGKQGPMLLQVSGQPFREGKGETAAASARILSGVYSEVPRGFTLNPAAAGAPQFRFRIAFDPPVSTTPDQVCAASSQKPLSYDRRDARQTLFMVFCRQEVSIAAVKARSDRMTSLTDPNYRNLLLQAAREMFQADANDTGSLGVLEFDPKPRIKLNPFEGIF